MKWIVKRDFLRTSDLADVELTGGCKGAPELAKYDEDKDHPLYGKQVSPFHVNHIHMGAYLELGTSKTDAELQIPDCRDPKRKLIAELRYSGCIGDAADKQVVARVERDVAAAAKKAAKAAEQAEAVREQNLRVLSEAVAPQK